MKKIINSLLVLLLSGSLNGMNTVRWLSAQKQTVVQAPIRVQPVVQPVVQAPIRVQPVVQPVVQAPIRVQPVVQPVVQAPAIVEPVEIVAANPGLFRRLGSTFLGFGAGAITAVGLNRLFGRNTDEYSDDEYSDDESSDISDISEYSEDEILTQVISDDEESIEIQNEPGFLKRLISVPTNVVKWAGRTVSTNKEYIVLAAAIVSTAYLNYSNQELINEKFDYISNYIIQNFNPEEIIACAHKIVNDIIDTRSTDLGVCPATDLLECPAIDVSESLFSRIGSWLITPNTDGILGMGRF